MDGMKKSSTYILMVGIFIFVSIFLMRLLVVNMNDRASTQLVQKLEGTNTDQEYYLFYNEANDSKNIILSFADSYHARKIEAVSLLQDEKVVSDAVNANDFQITNQGKFSITLTKFVLQFNQVRVWDENREEIFTLSTGQYDLENINVKTSDRKNQWYIDSYNSIENEKKFTINAKFTKSTDEKIDIKFMIPKKLKEKGILVQKETHIEKGNDLDLNYVGEINADNFREAENISYELMIAQQKSTGQQFTLMNIDVPLSIKH